MARILLVDDSANDLKILGNLLHDEYEVSLATSGIEALELVERQPPDLILLDIIMPGLNGFEVMERLAKNPKSREIPVVFLTVVDAVEEKVRGFQAGAVDYIVKPFEPLEVKARVRTHISLGTARRQLEQQNIELQEAAELRTEIEAIYRHDIKNPLHAILAAVEVMFLRGDLSDSQKGNVKIIQQAGLTILDMINRYFDLFKMEQGLYEVQAEAVDLGRIAQRIQSDMEHTMRAYGVHLEIESKRGTIAGSDRQHCVRGENMLCYSLLGNLMKNAIEASPKGQVVRVEIACETEGVFRVTNKGDVPQEIRDSFFEKFVTYGKSAGTGLGTYSAQLIAQLLGGQVDLDTSVPGETSVTVTLPLWQETEE